MPTHFVEQLDRTTIRVKEAKIITGRNLSAMDENYVVPAEWIYRLRVAGSIDRDFHSGAKKPADYGLPAYAVPAVGTPFPYPVHQLTTKFEDFDRPLSDQEFWIMSGVSAGTQNHYWSMIDRLTGAMALELSRAGYGLMDGKMECLMGPGRTLMIGDVFGTPDEDRFCPLLDLKQGRVNHHSKEFIRKLLVENGYFQQLKQARANKQNDPPIPRLSDELIEEVARRYNCVARHYAGVSL